MDPISMVCSAGTGCPFATGFGLPEILLWVLSFAVVFGILSKLQIFKGKASAALISIAIAFIVLMAVPATLLTVIAGMSTGLLVVAVGFLVVMALIEITGVTSQRKTIKDGKPALEDVHPFTAHSTAVAAILVIIAAAIFWTSGGAALIGLASLPIIDGGTILLIIVGIAVLWMLSE